MSPAGEPVAVIGESDRVGRRIQPHTRTDTHLHTDGPVVALRYRTPRDPAGEQRVNRWRALWRRGPRPHTEGR